MDGDALTPLNSQPSLVDRIPERGRPQPRIGLRRRELAVATTVILFAAPLRTFAQTGREASVIGFLGIATTASHAADLEVLRQGLEEVGHVMGRTGVIEERYADGSIDRLGPLLKDLLDGGAEVIVVSGLAAALAVREHAREVPVVAIGLPSTVIYPDLFEGLHRSGGSVTGFSHFGEDLAEKRIELLRIAVPALQTVAIMHNSVDPNYQRVTTMAEQRSFAAAGGLMSYGASFPDLFRRAAAYVDEILKGASPAVMPIQVATEFELVVNLRTAERLKITIPPSILLRADEVLE